MVRLFPRYGGPGPCPVCGARHSACTGEEGPESVYPEVIDMRFRPPYRFRSRRDVLRRLPNGNFEKVWGKGLPIPPEEALRQRIVTMEQLTPSEKTRVENYLVAQTKKQRDKVK